MLLNEAISLLEPGIPKDSKSETWADFGCGSGLFTLAISRLLANGSTVYAVDKNMSSFRTQGFPNHIQLIPFESDFLKNSLSIDPIDGLLMANSLHFVKDKPGFLEKVKPLFRNIPVFLLVEYDSENPNPWVPFPLSFQQMTKLFNGLGYRQITKLGEIPSRYRGKMYAARIE